LNPRRFGLPAQGMTSTVASVVVSDQVQGFDRPDQPDSDHSGKSAGPDHGAGNGTSGLEPGFELVASRPKSPPEKLSGPMLAALDAFRKFIHNSPSTAGVENTSVMQTGPAYVFVANNPVILYDSLGLDCWCKFVSVNCFAFLRPCPPLGLGGAMASVASRAQPSPNGGQGRPRAKTGRGRAKLVSCWGVANTANINTKMTHKAILNF